MVDSHRAQGFGRWLFWRERPSSGSGSAATTNTRSSLADGEFGRTAVREAVLRPSTRVEIVRAVYEPFPRSGKARRLRRVKRTPPKRFVFSVPAASAAGTEKTGVREERALRTRAEAPGLIPLRGNARERAWVLPVLRILHL